MFYEYLLLILDIAPLGARLRLLFIERPRYSTFPLLTVKFFYVFDNPGNYTLFNN